MVCVSNSDSVRVGKPPEETHGLAYRSQPRCTIAWGGSSELSLEREAAELSANGYQVKGLRQGRSHDLPQAPSKKQPAAISTTWAVPVAKGLAFAKATALIVNWKIRTFAWDAPVLSVDSGQVLAEPRACGWPQ